VLLSLSLQGRIGLGLDDEGFLWYGVQRFIEGDAPLRDFQSYEPGRYIWCAFTGLVFGEGILGLRAGVAVFQAIGLFFGLLCVARLKDSFTLLLISALLFLLWMHPRHKLFEPSIVMAAVFAGAFLLRLPSGFRHFLAGCFIGTAFFFGRNHGLYCLAGIGGIVIFLGIRNGLSFSTGRIVSFLSGIALGFVPIAIMAIVFTGFGSAFAESLFFHISTGNVNLSLPVPWPWNADLANINREAGIRIFSQGLLFAGIPVFYGAVLLKAFFSKNMDMERMAPIISCAFIGIPYLHHAYARADLSHLAQAIHPFLIGVLCLFAATQRSLPRITAWILVAAVSLLSLGSAATVAPAYEKWSGTLGPYVEVHVQGDRLMVPETTGKTIERLFSMERNYFSSGGEVMTAPHLPGAYAVLGRRSPVWQTYFFFPETEEGQKAIMREMDEKRVRWVILGNGTIDGREDLRFRNTHPLVRRYIMDAFAPVPGETLPGGYQLYKRIG